MVFGLGFNNFGYFDRMAEMNYGFACLSSMLNNLGAMFQKPATGNSTSIFAQPTFAGGFQQTTGYPQSVFSTKVGNMLTNAANSTPSVSDTTLANFMSGNIKSINTMGMPTGTSSDASIASMASNLGLSGVSGTGIDFSTIEQDPDFLNHLALFNNYCEINKPITTTIGNSPNIKSDLLSHPMPLTEMGLNYLTQEQSFQAWMQTRPEYRQNAPTETTDNTRTTSRRDNVHEVTRSSESRVQRQTTKPEQINISRRNQDRVNNLYSKAKSVTKYDHLINKYADKYNVDPLLIKSIISQESNWNPTAQSPAGAAGLMQLMPATARGLECTDRFNPEQNIKAGTLYISRMLKKYNGNVQQALAAYNAGPGHVNDILNGTNNHGKNPRKIKDPSGIPRLNETQNYVQIVYGLYNKLCA